jgi:hypothetical protein
MPKPLAWYVAREDGDGDGDDVSQQLHEVVNHQTASTLVETTLGRSSPDCWYVSGGVPPRSYEYLLVVLVLKLSSF